MDLRRSSTREEYADFHEKASFLGVWILVLLVGVHVLSSMRYILTPLLWALFLMMGLLPLTECIEKLLLRLCCCRQRRHGRRATPPEPDAPPLSDDDDTGTESEEAEAAEGSDGCGRTCTRTIAAALVVAIFLGSVTGFFTIIYQSAEHMKQNWHHYEEGFGKLSKLIDQWKARVPDAILRQLATKSLETMQEALDWLLSSALDKTTDLLFEILMMFLYMIFWLCEPVHVGDVVPQLFKDYIILKSFASATYAFCVWLLLHLLHVDLAIVFGLITFFFNFVPEVGPFVSILLPIPVILFDGRLDNPLLCMGLALIGQLCLKFIFANIVEVKLVERRDDMKMHPVMILFFVAFFGNIWGATGMLLSVPMMATVKATVHKFPVTYRNAILIALEGDKEAPERYMTRRDFSNKKLKKLRTGL